MLDYFPIEKTLWETYMNAYEEATQIPWKIFERGTRKKLCDDYGQLKTNELDDRKIFRIVSSTSKNDNKFFRVTVY